MLTAVLAGVLCFSACADGPEPCFGEDCGGAAPTVDAGYAPQCDEMCEACVVEICTGRCQNDPRQGVCFESCKIGPIPGDCI